MDNSKVKAFFEMKSLHWDERKTRPMEVYDEFAKKYFYIKENDKVLDLGCGTATFEPAILKCNPSKVVGLDIAEGMIERAKAKFVGNDKVEFIRQDFYDSDLHDFDVIVCHNAYAHITDPIAFKNKVLTTLKDHGILVISNFVGVSALNERHSHVNPELGRMLKSPDEEAEIYKDEFDTLLIQDEPCLVMAFQKK